MTEQSVRSQFYSSNKRTDHLVWNSNEWQAATHWTRTGQATLVLVSRSMKTPPRHDSWIGLVLEYDWNWFLLYDPCTLWCDKLQSFFIAITAYILVCFITQQQENDRNLLFWVIGSTKKEFVFHVGNVSHYQSKLTYSVDSHRIYLLYLYNFLSDLHRVFEIGFGTERHPAPSQSKINPKIKIRNAAV